MKKILCLIIIAAAPAWGQARETFGGKTEGGGPGGSPDTNCPCWRYPTRVLNYRRYDLRPLFAWWRDNYGAYKSASEAAGSTGQPPDFSSLPPSPLPGWERIKKGRFISNMALGWYCEAEIEDYPSHSVTNKIIIRNPPNADKDIWNNLVERYEELRDQAQAPAKGNPAPKHTHHKNSLAQYANNAAGASNNVTTSHPHNPDSGLTNILAQLQKFPEGTNYTVDLFALKLGYLQDGTHRQVFDLGQMYPK